MTIPNRTFIECPLPSIPTQSHGGGLSYWALEDGAKHTGITYLPTKKKLFFAGGDTNRGVTCDQYATGRGLSYTYETKTNTWVCVGGRCRATGQISPVGLDQPPTCYDPSEDCVWTASAKANDTSNPTWDSSPCTCADHPLGPKPAGSLHQRGVYKVNINSADQGSWEWTLEIQAGTTPPNNTENMLGWHDGLRFDNVTGKLITLSEETFRYFAKPLSKTNPLNEEYFKPADPDAGGFTSGPVSSDASNNHWALDVIGRWAYFITGATIRDATGEPMIIDPRLVDWPIVWTLYVGGHAFISPNEFTVNNDRTYDFPVGRVVKTTNTGGDCIGMISSSVYQSGPNTTLVTLQINAGDGQLDAGMSAIYLTSMDPLNAPRFWRYHIDLHIWQKLPDPPYRPYAPSVGMLGGPFNHRGWSTEIDCHMDTKNRSIIHFDHGLGGPSGKMEGVWVWDTTLKNDSGKIRQHSGPIHGGTWTNVPGPHPAWQFFPVVSTGPVLVEANEHCYDPGENVVVCGGSIDGSGSLHAMWHWRYQ